MQKRNFVNSMYHCGWAESGFGNLATEKYGMNYRCQIRNKGFRIEREVSPDKWVFVKVSRYSKIKDANGVRNLI